MVWQEFVEKEFISARFILAMMVIVGYIMDKVDPTIAGVIVAFYFGSKIVSQVANQPAP